MVDQPYELKRYISARHSRIMDSNNADHRGTSQAELDAATKECETLYGRGCKFIATISPEDLERCRKLCVFRTRNEYALSDLTETTIGDKRMLVPRHLVHIDELRKLQEILA
jgi:hypothetical protein